MRPSRRPPAAVPAALALGLLAVGCAARGEGAPPAARAPAAGAGLRGETAAGSLEDRYAATVRRIVDAARSSDVAYERLRHLCDRIGHRLSGSTGLERAVAWALDTMRSDGVENVRAEPVLVPAWIRGAESAEVLEPRAWRLGMLGLGNSVGTPPEGVTAEVVTARDFDALDALGDRVRGRIVLYTAAMPPHDPVRGTGYGETVKYRVDGPSRAAARGAVGVLVRSVTARSLHTPHTGMLRYADDAPRIPAAAVTVEDAETMERLVAAGERVVVRLRMEARFGPDAPSANVVGEIVGRERPEEVVVLAAHLDSWDVGHGAHDDGGPCVALMDALRILRALDLRPRCTLRVVLFTNEENGLRGGRAYAAAHAAALPLHRAALEADSGVFRPLGFTTPRIDDAAGRRRWAILSEVAALLGPWGAGALREGGGGADIAPMEPAGVPQVGLMVAMDRYFDLHHTEADTFDKVDRSEFDLCVGVLAAAGFVLADMEESPR